MMLPMAFHLAAMAASFKAAGSILQLRLAVADCQNGASAGRCAQPCNNCAGGSVLLCSLPLDGRQQSPAGSVCRPGAILNFSSKSILRLLDRLNRAPVTIMSHCLHRESVLTPPSRIPVLHMFCTCLGCHAMSAKTVCSLFHLCRSIILFSQQASHLLSE